MRKGSTRGGKGTRRQVLQGLAATSLLILGLISASLMLGIVGLAQLTHLQYVENPVTQITGAGPDYEQATVTAGVVTYRFAPASVTRLQISID